MYADGWKVVTNHVNQLTHAERDLIVGTAAVVADGGPTSGPSGRRGCGNADRLGVALLRAALRSGPRAGRDR